MKEKELRVNTFLKSFFDYEYDRQHLILSNLDVFYNIINRLGTPIQNFIKEHKLRINIDNFSKMSLVEQESIVDSFFESLGIDFKLNDIIKDGTLDLDTPLVDADSFLYYYSGHTGIKDNHTNIDAHNTGLISDSIVWVHEISHYRNEPDGKRSEVSDLLTEGISFAMQFIYLDYLKKHGFKYESIKLMHGEIDNYESFLYLGYGIIKLALVFDKLGSVSEENYDLLFRDNDYEKCLDILIKYVLDTGNHKLMANIFYYNTGYPLAMYMYMRYMKDPTFIVQIERFNHRLNENLSVIDMLKVIDLNSYNESMEKILDSIFNLLWELGTDLEKIDIKENNLIK